MADTETPIRSMVDGLNPIQRKILFCSFKRNFIRGGKVAKFCEYVSKHSAYHDQENLAETIIDMAHDFVGSNNINLLQPSGQFGTRYYGGNDHASPMYIYTLLSPMARLLFPQQDDSLLHYLNQDGQSIEPVWYMPIIPTVLVNGWCSSTPNYNPRDIIANLKRLMDGEAMVPMDPWYRGFKGSIDKIAPMSYTVNGVIEEINETRVRVTELPIGVWIQDYREFLETLRGTDPFITGFMEYHDIETVDFEIDLPEENLVMARQEDACGES